MKLVPYISTKKNELKNIVEYETPVNQSQMSDLDDEMKQILDSDLDEYSKSKLYSETLRKFLTYKQLHSQSDSNEKLPICLDIKSSNNSPGNIQQNQQKTKNIKFLKKQKSSLRTPVRKFKNISKKKKERTFLKTNTKLSTLLSKLIKDKGENESIWDEFSPNS